MPKTPTSKKIVLERPAKPRMPKRLAARIDKFYEMRQQRIAYSKKIREAEAVVAEMKAGEDEIAHELAKELRKQGGTRLSGEIATFTPGEDSIFSVEDWTAFYKHIQQTNEFDLLERRPSRSALKARQEDEELPPGIHADKKFTYSLVKAKRS